MNCTLFAKSRKNLKSLIGQFQRTLDAHGEKDPVSTRYRDAFFYLIGERWLTSRGVAQVVTLLDLCGLSATSKAKNVVSELLKTPQYEAFFPPHVNESFQAEMIGWLYQYWNSTDRNSVTWAITRGDQEGLHFEKITLATQIYTERYMADFLVQQVIKGLGKDGLTGKVVLDPACGSGHILLAVVRAAFQHLGENFKPWLLAGNLQGADIDPFSVGITRLAILLVTLEILHGHDVVQVALVLREAIRTVPAPLGTLCRKRSYYLSENFDVILTNPPYIGRRKLHQELRDYLSMNYPTAAGDLAFAFTVRCIELLKDGGHLALVSNDKWIRLRSYYGLRWSASTVPGIFSHLAVHSLVELGGRAFHREAELHDGVGVALLHASKIGVEPDRIVRYLDLTNSGDPDSKALSLSCGLDSANQINQQLFSSKDVGSLLLQSAMPHTASSNGWDALRLRGSVVVGIQSNDDRKYVAPQWLVPAGTPGWVVHHRGGGVQTWYGLNRWMLNLDGLRKNLRKDNQGDFPVERWFNCEGWTYSWFANGTLALRKKEAGWSFGRAAASGVFVDDERIVGFLNSSLGSNFASKLSGKVQLTEGVVRGVPVPQDLSAISRKVVFRLIEIQKTLSAQDLREVHFDPAQLKSPFVRIELEAELRHLMSLLERQCFEAARMPYDDKSRGNLEGTAGDVVFEPGREALQLEERVIHNQIAEARVWEPYVIERLHIGALEAVGHRWRGGARLSQSDYTELSDAELASRMKSICIGMIECDGVPERVIGGLVTPKADWVRRMIQSQHKRVFGSYPLLKFTDVGVRHVFSQTEELTILSAL